MYYYLLIIWTYNRSTNNHQLTLYLITKKHNKIPINILNKISHVLICAALRFLVLLAFMALLQDETTIFPLSLVAISGYLEKVVKAQWINIYRPPHHIPLTSHKRPDKDTTLSL